MKKFTYTNQYGYKCFINLDEVVSYYIVNATYGTVLKVLFKNNNNYSEFLFNEKYAKDDIAKLEKLILENK